MIVDYYFKVHFQNSFVQTEETYEKLLLNRTMRENDTSCIYRHSYLLKCIYENFLVAVTVEYIPFKY